MDDDTTETFGELPHPGALAYAAGKTLDDNPHSANAPDGVAWREAWRAAEHAAVTRQHDDDAGEG